MSKNADAPKKKGKGKVIAIVVVILLIIGVLGSGGESGSSSNDSNKPAEKSSVVSTGDVDKSLLESIVNNAKGNDESAYTADSYAALAAAIDAADAVLADPEATQDQVDDAREAVTEAVSALVEKDAPTMGQQNALRKAGQYLDTMPFSYEGLIDQLEFEGYTTEEATYAADNCGADWNEQAAEKAQDYIDMMSFSKSGLIDQLKFEGFTQEQAEYGAKAVGY